MTLTTADYLLRGRGLGRGEARHLAAPHLAQAHGAPPPLPGTLRVVEHWGGARSTLHITHYTANNTAQHNTSHITIQLCIVGHQDQDMIRTEQTSTYCRADVNYDLWIIRYYSARTRKKNQRSLNDP